jgi:exonuclease III
MMKIITWNIRGLNGRSKQRILRDCIKTENPDILMIQETKCAGAEVEIIFQCIWRGCDFVQTDSSGASGGLAILWNPNTTTLSRSFSTIGTITTHFEVIGSNQEGTCHQRLWTPKSAGKRQIHGEASSYQIFVDHT